jgi:hypothetical protein
MVKPKQRSEWVREVRIGASAIGNAGGKPRENSTASA